MTTSDPQHVVHAPVSPGTAPDDHEAHIVRPQTSTATVQITTVHNWVELVYKAFGFSIPTGATEVALLGVREASLSGKGGVETLESEAAQGDTKDVGFTSEARDGTFSTSAASAHATTWNDLLFLVYTPTKPEEAQNVEVFECTIDAGKSESSLGMPITLEGKLYGGYPGSHQPKKYPGSNVALHLFTGSHGKILLARECTGTRRTFEEVASAENAHTNWRFVSVEDNDTIHMHFGSEGAKVGGWSTGCTVLHHHLWIRSGHPPYAQDPKATRYKRFMQLYNGASNKQQIPYLVVSSQYVRSYAEWVRLLDQTPGQAPKPETVIMKDKLVSAPGAPGKYLPTIVTSKFMTDTQALAADPKTSPTHAANLRSSLDLIPFTLAI